MQTILASASPRRQELLKFVLNDFKIIPSAIDEVFPSDMSPLSCPEYLAILKACEISKIYKDNLVIGCDTCVIIDDQILGKPKDTKDAFRMISLLSGKTHKVVTGCCLSINEKIISFSEITDVEFYKLTSREIDDYINTGEPYDKAGSYAIQGHGALLIKGINGDYYNVMGLPISRLSRVIKEFMNI